MSYRPQRVAWIEEHPFRIKRKHCPLRAELTCQDVGGNAWLITIVGGTPLAVRAQLKAHPITDIAALRREVQTWLRYSCTESALRFTGFRETTVDYVGGTPSRIMSIGMFHYDE